MEEFISQQATTIRLSSFIAIFCIISLAEAFFPRRALTHNRLSRWPSNIGIVFFNTILIQILNPLLVRVLIPLSAVWVATLAKDHQFGLFHWLNLPSVVGLILSVVILDCIIYFQHVVFHRVPLLWRLHRMHHADLEYDLTLGSRFHPIEIILSMMIKMFFVVLLGAPVAAVVIFEVILNAMAVFNHGNFKLPLALDNILRKLVVTPDFHRVHHSDIPRETHSNYGFNLSWWDRIFKTYVAQPEKGHEKMIIGLPVFRDPKYLKLPYMLKIPFEN